MGTGTSRRRVALAALTLAFAGGGVAGCGTTRSASSQSATTGATGTASSQSSTTGGIGTATNPSAASGAFAWLQPKAPPSGWKVVAIPSGAAMAYPPSWELQHGDPGTATATLTGAGDQILGYVNLTPRQGPEALANWPSFRLDHNGDEGDKDIRRLAVGTGLHFRDGRGACVKDSYATISRAHYVEIACLVSGPHGEAVIVAAAPPGAWSRESSTLERAVEGVRT